MNDYPRLLEEFCREGNLHNYRFSLVKIFAAIDLNPCKISCQYISPASSITFLPEGPIIRVAIKGRKNPLHIIWDLLHEYGHFVIGPNETNDKNKMAVNEYHAWKFVSKMMARLPELDRYKIEYEQYKQECLSTYIEKLQLNYDVEAILKKYMPSIIELLGGQSISWTSINKGLTQHISEIRKEFYATGKLILKETSFYSMIAERFTGTGKSNAMFDYYDTLFKKLNTKLTSEEKQPVRRIILQLLTNLNNNHMNFIGELSVLDKYISTGQYYFVNIEARISSDSNVTADIYLKRKLDGSDFLVEVLNLHLEKTQINDYSKFKYHLDSKFTQKIKSKGISDKREVKIQPVLWYTDHNQFKWVQDFFLKTDYVHPDVLDPMCYCSYFKHDGSYQHWFDRIKFIK